MFSVSLFAGSLLVRWNVIDFCELIFHCATLLNFLISSVRFLIDSLEFSIKAIMPFVNGDSFISSLPSYVSISFSCLIVLARTSSTKLNKWWEKISFFCFQPQGENVEYFSIEHDVSWKLLVDAVYQVAEVPSSPSFPGAFIMNECWILPNVVGFFLHKLLRSYDLSSLACQYGRLHWFLNILNQSCIPRIKFHFIMV